MAIPPVILYARQQAKAAAFTLENGEDSDDMLDPMIAQK